MVDQTVILGKSKPSRDQRREAILTVARKVFTEEGFACASMSAIAARLGGSKGTLYNYFRSKEELFEAHVQDQCSCNAESIFAFPMDGHDAREVLTGVAERFLHMVLSDESTRFYATVVAEAQRHPEVGRAFYDKGPATCIRRLSEFLERARADGQLAIDDCVRGAEEFLSLCHGGFQLKRVLNIVPCPTETEMQVEAKRVVALFMRAYAPPA